MATYFNNKELDALWARLVTSTRELISTKSITLKNTGIIGIHDALLEYSGLTRNKTEDLKFCDYMKGIAVCARELNLIKDLSRVDSLSTIISLIESLAYLNNFTYKIVNDKAIITKIKINSGQTEVFIPGIIEGYPTVFQPSSAITNNTITSIVFGEGMIEIG
jgi:hypothetical protein